MTAAAVVVIAALAAALGGFSRSSAEYSTRFITFVVITTGLGPVADPVAVGVVFGLGAGGAAAVTLLAALTTRALATRRGRMPVGGESTPSPPPRALLRHWRASLRTLRGWRYTLRLTLCLALAEVIGVLWHHSKAYWIAVTVVIVVRRDLGEALTRLVQRAAGTAAGVMAGSAVLLWVLPPWLLVPVVATLAALRPTLKNRNHMMYAMVMTPLVLLLLGAGDAVSPTTIAYRMGDTVVGCVIALCAGYLPWLHPRLNPPPRVPAGQESSDENRP
ncbi:FUSC family protein [Streptosporangium sp. CA-135522]|uniref:FUSC family protein n=1 Tax=Streptosporangium sp. CA-135522 TaxID=3240072 RepID=UPI003D8A1538